MAYEYEKASKTDWERVNVFLDKHKERFGYIRDGTFELVVVHGNVGRWLAKVLKVPPAMYCLLGYRYVVQVFDFVLTAPGKYFDRIMFHEFLHFCPVMDGALVDHDIQDFVELIKHKDLGGVVSTHGWGKFLEEKVDEKKRREK